MLTVNTVRVLAVTVFMIVLQGCAHTNDLIVAKQTAERLKYFTNPQGEQYVREMIEYHATRR